MARFRLLAAAAAAAALQQPSPFQAILERNPNGKSRHLFFFFFF
jgi:hypothetical protein